MQRILVTGFAGFIGYSMVQRLREKHKVAALDNFSEVSNRQIKTDRAKQLGIEDPAALKNGEFLATPHSLFYHADLADINQLEKIFSTHTFDAVVHLAALTGVRQSLLQPQLYVDANVKGFVNLLETAHKHGVKRIIYASSSSVYGLNSDTPYTEEQLTDSPISVYAASKKADELLAHVYSHLYNMHITGLRFFTVYGPWTRPDMAAFIFMKAISEGKPIELFNGGRMVRDFTFVDDVVQAISMLLEKENTGKAGHEVFNIGNNNPVLVTDFLQAIEKALGKKAVIIDKPMQPGDMAATNASSRKLYEHLGFEPSTSLENGVAEMVKWYLQYAR